MGFFDALAVAWSPQAIGDSVEGEVLFTTEKQQTEVEFDKVTKKYVSTDRPKFWKNGQPAMSLVVTLQAFAKTPDDNGQRSVFINRPSRFFSAALNALKSAGADDIQIGDWMKVTFIGLDPESAQGNAKMYAVEYRKAATSLGQALAADADQAAAVSAPNTAGTPDEASVLLARLAELQGTKPPF